MTYRFGLLGYPLTYSLSPQIHQVFLEECGLEGEYRLIPIAVNDETDANLKAVLTQMKNQAYHGLNVTIPYKQTVKDLLDCLDDKAQAVGAVNTIYRKGEALIGTNTDVEGFFPRRGGECLGAWSGRRGSSGDLRVIKAGLASLDRRSSTGTS